MMISATRWMDYFSRSFTQLTLIPTQMEAAKQANEARYGVGDKKVSERAVALRRALIHLDSQGKGKAAARDDTSEDEDEDADMKDDSDRDSMASSAASSTKGKKKAAPKKAPAKAPAKKKAAPAKGKGKGKALVRILLIPGT